MDVNSHNCPNCRELVEPHGSLINGGLQLTWYKCGKCRHTFRCTASSNGVGRVVSAESPHTAKQAPLGALSEPSPCCGVIGRVRDTWRDERGYFRKHLCRNCEKPFYTCTIEPSGEVKVYAVRPAAVRSQLEVY